MPDFDEAVHRLAVQQRTDLHGVAPAETYTAYYAQLQQPMLSAVSNASPSGSACWVRTAPTRLAAIALANTGDEF